MSQRRIEAKPGGSIYAVSDPPAAATVSEDVLEEASLPSGARYVSLSAIAHFMRKHREP